jgi:PAS domain S-box-containing protein
VDDRADGLIALESVLKIPEVRVVKAQSGKEALSLLTQHEFGLILLDVQMPEMDGFETALHIRDHAKHKFTPIIFVTAINKDDRYIYRGYEAGAVDYIFKPFDAQIVRAKVSIFIELFRKSRRLREQATLIRESEMRERYLRLAELEVESLKRYRNLADAIPHMVWRARADGTLDYFNRGWSEYTGLSIEQSVGSGWQSAFHKEDLPGFLKLWMQSMEQVQSFDMECRIYGSDKNWRWHWVQVVCEKSSSICNSWLATCTDIHERKEAQQEAQAANMAKTSFLANMSHEIRTPMSSILGFTELMRDPNQSEEERVRCLNTVQRNGQQLLRIIDEILDISKVEAGQMRMEKVPVKIGTLIADLHALLHLKASEKGLGLEFNLERSVPATLVTDPTRLRQVLINLTANAIKFTETGQVSVVVDWLPIESKIQFSVRDTGIGIDSAKVPNLFQPFSQVDNSITRHFGGSGLGLVLSRELARAMGGDVILAETKEGVGSTFVVEVIAQPEGEAMLEKLDLASERESTAKSWSGSAHEQPLAGINVLLVDDLIDNRELLGRVLTMAGANVDTAENGRDGVEKAMAGEYAVVLMDIQMPLLDGYQATRQLRKNGFSSPIIALTAHGMKEERDRCIEAGCNAHLTKPIKLHTLIEHVSQVAHGR